MGKKVAGMSRDFEQALLKHHWRGNVRELRNFIERALILTNGHMLEAGDIPPGSIVADLKPESPVVDGPQVAALPTTATTLAEVERLHITRVLAMTNGNKSRAAELLGIGLTTLYRKLEDYASNA